MSAKKTVFMRSSLLALAPVLATLLPATPLLAQDESLPMPPVFLKAMEPMVERAAVSRKVVVTRHKGEFGGRKLAYDAIVSETPVQNAKGRLRRWSSLTPTLRTMQAMRSGQCCSCSTADREPRPLRCT